MSNQQFQLTYLDRNGNKRKEVHGDEGQAVGYAIAYESAGFNIISLVNKYTGRQVPYTRLPPQSIPEFGYDDRKDKS